MNHKVLQVMHFYILSNDCKEKINLGHTIYSPDTASFIHYLQTLFFLAWLQVIRLIFYLAYVRVMKWEHVVRSNRLINDDDMYMTTWLGWVLGNIDVLSNENPWDYTHIVPINVSSFFGIFKQYSTRQLSWGQWQCRCSSKISLR